MYDEIEWGAPRRHVNSGIPCPSYIPVRVRTIVKNKYTVKSARLFNWLITGHTHDIGEYYLPLEYEKMLRETKPTDKEMLEILRENYIDLPTKLIRKSPARKAYDKTLALKAGSTLWEELSIEERLLFRKGFNAGIKHEANT